MDIRVDADTVWCFDLDDTLYNELDYLRSAYADIARYLDPKNSVELYARMFSMYRNRDNVFDFLTGTYTISKEELLTHYREHKPHLAPFPGVRDLLTQIKEISRKLVCITDGRSLTQRNKLEALGLLSLFDLLVISEEVGTSKPSPLNYILVEEHFPQKTYTYVADNFKKDFIVPNERGWGSIGLMDNGKNIHNTAFEYMALDKHRPQGLIRYISDLRIT